MEWWLLYMGFNLSYLGMVSFVHMIRKTKKKHFGHPDVADPFGPISPPKESSSLARSLDFHGSHWLSHLK